MRSLGESELHEDPTVRHGEVSRQGDTDMDVTR